jgi:dipeptidyl aminopeptidase/acylaminoacyl peptidase
MGASLLTLVGPAIGETIATLPPLFSRQDTNPLTDAGLSYEEVAFPTDDGLMLRGWFIPADQAGAPAVLYVPGTGRDQRSGLSLAAPFHTAGYHVLLFSYRGSGQSDGNWLRFSYGDAESRDVDAAVRFLSETKGVSRVATIGYSAGAVSAILSAARNPQIGAVVAVAPYNCVEEVWQTGRPAVMPAFLQDLTLWLTEKRKGFDRDRICPVNVVDQIAPRPLLVIHGTEDRRILESQVERLFAAASEPKSLWLVPGATHNSIRTPVLDELSAQVVGFLDGAFGQAVSQAPIAPPAAQRKPQAM